MKGTPTGSNQPLRDPYFETLCLVSVIPGTKAGAWLALVGSGWASRVRPGDAHMPAAHHMARSTHLRCWLVVPVMLLVKVRSWLGVSLFTTPVTLIVLEERGRFFVGAKQSAECHWTLAGLVPSPVAKDHLRARPFLRPKKSVGRNWINNPIVESLLGGCPFRVV